MALLAAAAALSGCSPSEAPAELASETRVPDSISRAPDSLYWDYPETPDWARHPILVLADEHSDFYPDLPHYELGLPCTEAGHLDVSGETLLADMHGSTHHLKRISLVSDTVRLSGTPHWPTEPFVYWGDLLLPASHEDLTQLIGGSSFTVIESWSDGVHATIYPPPPPELAQAFLSACLEEDQRGASD